METLVNIQNTCNFYTDKNTAHSYLPAYDKIFSAIPEIKNVLEIGIHLGGSLLLWSKYFPVSTNIYSIDVYLKNLNEQHYTIPNATVIQKDVRTCTENFLQPIMFDIIIDDGSHYLDDQLHVYNTFKSRLTPGGVLLIEDIQPNNLQKFIDICQHDPKATIIDLRNIKDKVDDIILLYKN